MRTDNVSKVILSVQNSLGIIMCKFRAVQSKTEGMAASVRVFFEHPSYKIMVPIFGAARCCLKTFLIKSSGGPIIQRS